jgi:hypothetical protein
MLQKERLEQLKIWFDNYVQSFRSDDRGWQENIDIKIDHSEQVRLGCREIGQSLSLNEGELRLAEAAGLFHDIGRFEQFLKYKTFSDHKSVNHAELGVCVLADHGVLDSENPEVKRIVLGAVANHNKLEVPADESGDVRFYSKLVRDADKLDIWRVVSMHYCSEAGIGSGVNQDLPDTPGVSPAVVDVLMQCRLVRMALLKNVNDFKLLQIGWVYDVNFPKTLALMRERGHLERIRNSITAGEAVSEVYAAVMNYTEQRLKTGDSKPRSAGRGSPAEGMMS